MEFKKYQHIEKFGSEETEDINKGTCHIFPKIDGTNAQLWMDEGLHAGSRKRELSIDSDNAGFYEWAQKQENIIKFFSAHPNLRLMGEWLVPHSLKTYKDDAWRKFYVFDVMNGDDYLSYDEYKPILEKFNIEYIPLLAKIENPTHEELVELLDKNTYLIEEGKGVGEGIVIKNYAYKNKFGRTTWAKIVKSDFRNIKKSNLKHGNDRIIEKEIVEKYINETLVQKEYAKITNETGWSSKMIPRLLNTVYYCLIKEESWDFVKEYKNPVIDFKKLNFYSNERVKEIIPQLFN
jgi:hypothetical protein